MTLAERCRAIELLVLDVDGVLTDGGIVYGAGEGKQPAFAEWKQYFVRDGSGLALWRKAGRRAAIITGRKSPLVDVRATEVGIVAVIQGAADKGEALTTLLDSQGVRPEQAAFVGDDVVDVPAMLRCGLAAAVADACSEALAAAHYVTLRPGGRGAVREVIERVLRCQGRWALNDE